MHSSKVPAGVETLVLVSTISLEPFGSFISLTFGKNPGTSGKKSADHYKGCFLIPMRKIISGRGR